MLSVITFGNHLIENVTRTFGVAHVNISTRQVQLGGRLIRTGEEIEVIITVPRWLSNVTSLETRPSQLAAPATGRPHFGF